jgi:hypothetical protein
MSWHDYNEALVERGRVLFDLGFSSSWKSQVDAMNEDKVGRPYTYPNSYIEFLSFLKVGFDIPYRMVQGITTALSEYISFFREIHFTQIRRRLLALMKGRKPSEIVKVDEGEEPLTIVVDSSGLTTTNKGSYIEDTWKKERRRYVKLHLVADKKTKKILGFRVTNERTADTKKFIPMVREVVKRRKVARAYGDTAYDARRNFNLLDEEGIEPAIKLKKNAITRSLGSPLRRREAVLVKRLGCEGWKSLKDYGKRWIAEIVLSSFKRVLGEVLRSRKFLCQKAEVSLKVMLYNRFLSIGP